MFSKSKISLAALALLAVSAVSAQTKAPEPDYTLSYNIGVVSDYRFRGITQTNFGGALQGGIDFAHKSGFYAGAWASNVSWVKEFNGANNGSYELDLYAGFKGEIAKDLSFDIGLIGYMYPGNDSGNVGTPGAGLAANANTTEFYGALTYSYFTLKYNQSAGNFLGFINSSGARYWDLSANFDLSSGFTLTPHVGRQTVPNQGIGGTQADYSDYSLTLNKDFGKGFMGFLAAYGTSADQTFYVNSNGNTNFIGKSGAAVGVKYSF